MKKSLMIVAILLSFSFKSSCQEVFISATSKSDSYLTLGYVKNGWGLFVGKSYSNDLKSGLGRIDDGYLPDNFKAGVIRTFNQNIMTGVGIKGSAINFFAGYSPIKIGRARPWIIGDVTGNRFSGGIGMSYSFEKTK